MTKGKIPSIIDFVSEDTRAVLLNAVYFKGEWEAAFDASLTEMQTFFNNGKTAIKVPLMFKEVKNCKLFSLSIEHEELQMLQLPYNGNVAMHILMTKSVDGLEKILPKIKLSTIDEMEIISHKADLWLPKFKLETKYELIDALEQMGIKEPFTSHANFGKMRRNKDIYISQVTHKALIEVNEEGTVAAAVTAISMVLYCSLIPPIPQFRVDHPFIFFVKDTANDIILFLGKVDEL
ncbi:putative serpin-like protein [Dinothrombium tinctorium]|uniref:Putative serpin-like protein n=1 Tax=Dinothrombium tinctorium TaxID=1965070 RepID=A0A443Q601_9ACAR|nr:putative serpin-like protein [Dinothrombium tinctorium]